MKLNTVDGMFASDFTRSVICQLKADISKPFTVIVSGVERGGTSMIAATLAEMGIDMGPRGSNHEDPNMFSEDLRFLCNYVASRNNSYPRWGFKRPGAHMVPALLALTYRQPIWIFVYRNVASNIDSLVARGDPNELYAFRRIMKNYTAMAPLCEKSDSSFILVSYERATANPMAFVQELADALCIYLDPVEKARALSVIARDGGGYRASSTMFHHFTLVPADRLTIHRKLASSVETTHGGMTTKYRTPVSGHVEYFAVSLLDEQAEFVTVILDFGSGLSDLAAYDILIEQSGSVIRLEHRGAVESIAFGFRGTASSLRAVIQHARPLAVLA